VCGEPVGHGRVFGLALGVSWGLGHSRRGLARLRLLVVCRPGISWALGYLLRLWRLIGAGLVCGEPVGYDGVFYLTRGVSRGLGHSRRGFARLRHYVVCRSR